MIIVESSDREITKELILDMKGGIVAEDDLKNLESCVSYATHLWVGYIRGRPACAWGLVPPTILSDKAYLWLYHTEAIEEFKFNFVRQSQLAMEEMRECYPTIYGVCSVEQPKSIRWLKWLGAKFGRPVNGYRPFIIGGELG